MARDDPARPQPRAGLSADRRAVHRVRCHRSPLGVRDASIPSECGGRAEARRAAVAQVAKTRSFWDVSLPRRFQPDCHATPCISPHPPASIPVRASSAARRGVPLPFAPP
eukprot:355048-Chlamydomonas_euryale.AAC.5